MRPAATASSATPVEPRTDRVFHVEQHGIDFIPRAERWARPRDLAGMWAGASINIEYLVYGAILLGFGFTLRQTIVLIVLGNLSWVLVGLCSLQGPQTGTTTFGSNRAAFGPRGSTLLALFNWLTMIGFEVEGLILIVGATLVLLAKAGIHTTTTTKVVVVFVAVAIQAVLPALGHATMTRVLRGLVLPFVAIYLGLLGLSLSHLHATAPPSTPATWQLWTVGLAFSITLSGLGWTECGNDYSRYVAPSSSRPAIVAWVVASTAIPQVLLMILGAAVVSFLGSAALWSGANPFLAFQHSAALPGWFVVVFLAFTIVQLFSINSLDLYSSGVTLQALGLRLRRSQAVLLDSAICLVVTLYAVLSSGFSAYLKDFVDVVIIWIAPWCAIYLVDWAMRRGVYDPGELQRTEEGSRYWATGGVHLPAMVAQLVGMAAALSALNTSFALPSWLHPLTVATESSAAGGAFSGADFSVFAGMLFGGLTYWVLCTLSGSLERQRIGPRPLLDA